MTEVAHKSPPRPPRTQRLGVAEAKSRLSELLRHTADGPTIIHSRGRDVAVVLAVEDYDRLVAERNVGSGGGAQFLERVEILKQRHGAGVDDFAPTPVTFQPIDPFARKSGTRR